MAIRSKHGIIAGKMVKLMNDKNLERLKKGKQPLQGTKIQDQIAKLVEEDPLLYEKFIQL